MCRHTVRKMFDSIYVFSGVSHAKLLNLKCSLNELPVISVIQGLAYVQVGAF